MTWVQSYVGIVEEDSHGCEKITTMLIVHFVGNHLWRRYKNKFSLCPSRVPFYQSLKKF